MITPKQASETVARFGALKYFPTNPIAQAEIADVLLRMVENEQQLDWLVATMMDRVGEWHGPRELRAVYCTRFKPLDGIEAWSQITGFTSTDSEAAHSLEQAEFDLQQLEPPEGSNVGLNLLGGPRLEESRGPSPEKTGAPVEIRNATAD